MQVTLLKTQLRLKFLKAQQKAQQAENGGGYEARRDPFGGILR